MNEEERYIQGQLDELTGEVLFEDVETEFVQPGELVWYQTDGRNNLDYVLPAIVTVTRQSHPGDYPDGRKNSLKVPSSERHVHLTVLTPGGFGSTYTADRKYEEFTPDNQGDLENLGRPERFQPGSGTYVEHDVVFDMNGSRRSWRWPT